MELSSIGITPAKEKQLKKKGIFSVEDLINFFPRKYDDLSEETGLLPEELVSCIIVNINDVKLYNNTNTPLIIASGIDKDSGERVKIMWFRQQYLYNSIYNTIGHDVFVAGKAVYNAEYNNYSITGPLAYTTNIKDGMKIVSVYSKIQGMSDSYLTEHINTALAHTELINETLPSHLLESENLMDIKTAVKELHTPSSIKYLEEARRRMIFDDLLYFAVRLEQINRKSSKGSPFNIQSLTIFNKVKSSLPFNLTTDQNDTVNQMIDNIKNGKRINALIQGDTGCGKSITAFLLMIAMLDNGYQSVLMAPTQVLARQHYKDLVELLSPYGVKIAFMGGSQMKKSEKQELLNSIRNGDTKIIVGTHSVLNKDIEFNNLALTITDEEHRFGTIQRESLVEKASKGVHSITMSATPIPRSLAQVVYGDGIQLYTIKTMPAGRLPVKTAISSNQKSVFKFIKQEIDAGHQCYIVCPMIDQNEKIEGVLSVEEVSKIYHSEFDKYGISIDTLTGKNSKIETDEIIERFKENKTNILISTTVIEVGVNVPNATVITIQNAERFGLASLHQLRGRVGRSKQQSYCILFSEDKDNERLNVLVNTNDGFKVAEEDLRIRGAGNFIGTEQSGDNKYVSLMLSNQELYKHLKDIACSALDTGILENFINRRLKNEEKDL